MLQIARWLPGRRIVVVADSGFSAIDLLDAVRERVCVVTRLRLDARLFAPAQPRKAGRSAGRDARRNACPRSRSGWPIPPRLGHR